jgi:uncharacterized repeat protein (TIGR03833 family)
MRDDYNFSESIINPYKNKEQGSTMDGKERKNIMSGKRVSIVLKEDQSTGRLTEGVVRDILTKSPNHPHGIKVRLMSGEVGRVKEVF